MSSLSDGDVRGTSEADRNGQPAPGDLNGLEKGAPPPRVMDGRDARAVTFAAQLAAYLGVSVSELLALKRWQVVQMCWKAIERERGSP